MFNAALRWEHRYSQPTVPFPYPDVQGSPITGNSYPIMFLLGSLSVPSLHYITPLIQTAVPHQWMGYALFGAGVCGVEYACGKLGKAPWKEVYKYLEARCKQKYTWLKKTPLTLEDGSVFLPLLPAWAAMGAGVQIVHDTLVKH